MDSFGSTGRGLENKSVPFSRSLLVLTTSRASVSFPLRPFAVTYEGSNEHREGH